MKIDYKKIKDKIIEYTFYTVILGIVGSGIHFYGKNNELKEEIKELKKDKWTWHFEDLNNNDTLEGFLTRRKDTAYITIDKKEVSTYFLK